LRRAVPSFTVEVRRRPKRATTLKPDALLSEARSPRAEFDRASPRPFAAAFAAKKADPSPTEVASSPKGRILPSLVLDESLRRTLQDAAPTPTEYDPPPALTPKRPPVRTWRGKDQASKLPPQNSRVSFRERRAGGSESVDQTTSSVRRAIRGRGRRLTKGCDERAKSSCRRLRRSGAERKGKAKRHKVAISRDDLRVKPLPNDLRSAMEADSPATIPSRVDDHSPQSRKRTIMARYVFGDELKPGGRWKRRVLTMR
jgi:hypothetical protein